MYKNSLFLLPFASSFRFILASTYNYLILLLSFISISIAIVNFTSMQNLFYSKLAPIIPASFPSSAVLIIIASLLLKSKFSFISFCFNFGTNVSS